jgi:hypothetical protein
VNTSTAKVLRFAIIATSIVAIAGATVVAPGTSAESAPRDSRSKIFKQYESLADYAESDGRNPQVWMPETGISKKAWASSIQDESVRVDSAGRALVIDALQSVRAPNNSSPESATPAGDVPLEDAFLLNSLPGSNRTIYLDFTGHSLAGTYWQLNIKYVNGVLVDGPDYTNLQMEMPAYDVDGNTAAFSNLERQNIIDTWSAVAEDYAPFNVNVTTADPGDAALERTNGADSVFGARALITDTENVIGSTCGCGGIAYVDVFDYADWNTYLGPALNFAQNWFDGKTISDVVSHEVGHNLGLLHDGGVNPPETVAEGYYDGHDGWAPVMGVGYYEPLVQFSNGTYTSGNNNQDDYAVALGNGIDLRADDHGDARGTASALTNGTESSGYIATRTDVDYFSFVATATSHVISVTSPSLSTNLDIQAKLFNSSDTLLSTTNPNFFRASTTSATGLDAVFTATTTPGDTYYIAVDGVGYGSGTTTGYSDYGSLGEYRIDVAGDPALTMSAGTATISGTAKVKKTLTARATGWGSGVTITYKWLRNGSTISSATRSTYKLSKSDKGKRISVQLRVAKAGYATLTSLSAQTKKVAG